MIVSEDERLTLVVLAAVLVIGSVLVGYPIDWSTVSPSSLAKLALLPTVVGGLSLAARGATVLTPTPLAGDGQRLSSSSSIAAAAAAALDPGLAAVLATTTVVGGLTDLARSALHRRRPLTTASSAAEEAASAARFETAGPWRSGGGGASSLVRLALRLALVLVSFSRIAGGGSTLVRRLLDGATTTANRGSLVTLGAVVVAWAVSEGEIRRVAARLLLDGGGTAASLLSSDDEVDASAAEEALSVEAKVAALEDKQVARWGDWSFTVEEGYFVHDATPDGLVPAAVMPRLGLLDDSPSRWRDLQGQVAALNAGADPLTKYKLLFVQRHGEGWHNRAETFYGHGSSRWCDEMARLYFGDGMVWGPDPELTPLGLEQAADVARGWATEVREGGATAVLPEVLWSSPLKRAAMTLAISYGEVLLASPGAPRPVIKEHLRERLGVHTCDIRPPAYEMETVLGRVRNPTNPLNFVLEPGFTKDDDLWSPTERETDESMNRRARLLLSELFASHDAPHVALAGHGGIILALFRTVAHKACATPTGAFIPMVVKGVRSH